MSMQTINLIGVSLVVFGVIVVAIAIEIIVLLHLIGKYYDSKTSSKVVK